MPTNQTLLWITLPNGVQTNDDQTRDLRLSVFVNPRLRSEEGFNLSLFPDFLNWADRMQPDKVSFIVEVNDGTKIQQVPATIVSNPPDPLLWKRLFNQDIPVRPYDFAEDNLYNHPIVTYPVKEVSTFIKERYQKIASESPFDLPSITRGEKDPEGLYLTNEFQELGTLHLRIENEEDLTQRLNDSLKDARNIARNRQMNLDVIQKPIIPESPFGKGVSEAFYQSMLFFYRSSKSEPVELPNDSEAKAHFEEEFDFHQMLSALGDFPKILRRLGLVVDLKVKMDDIPKINNEYDLGKMKLRVIPSWTSTFPTRKPETQVKWTADYSPWTCYIYANFNGLDIFRAFSTQEDTIGLWSPGSGVDLVQVDIDGAALKTINFTGSLKRAVKNVQGGTIDTSTESSVPSLRTGGISVVHNDQANYLNKTFFNSAKLNAMLEDAGTPELADLYAEDLTRGFRLDVFDGAEWRSLHQRVGHYNILNGPDPLPELIEMDEGFHQPSVTSNAGPSVPEKEIYAHESLFTWDGWSLSAPRPGKSISRSPNAPDPDDPETMPQKVDNTAMTRLGLETTFQVKDSSLPRLRFGQSYKMRIRTVDLAGNGLTLDDAKSLETVMPQISKNTYFPKNDELIYQRFEPINPPELVPRQLYSPDGNINGPNVNGFAEGESVERMVIRSNFNQTCEEYAVEHPTYFPYNDRHVVAPKASLELVETHGLLDEALDAKKSGLPEDQVRARIREIYDIAVREAGTLNDQSLPSVRFISTADADSLTDGYAVHTEEQLEIPYLPDPWAAGVVFQGLPGLDKDELLPIKFAGDVWYRAVPFRIRLMEGEEKPAWDEITRILTVYLPKSKMAVVRVSSLFGGSLKSMGIWQWLHDAFESGDITKERMNDLVKGILDSRHWMFTPYRELTLVHAVQQPLLEPSADLNVIREQGSTEGYLHGYIKLHVPSTSKLDILAEWNEFRDNKNEETTDSDPALPINVSAHVMEVPLIDSQNIHVAGKDVECRTVGPDVLRVEEDYYVTFHSKQAENTVRCLRRDLANQQIGWPQDRRTIQDQMNMASKITPQEFGDTKYRRVRYKVQATSRFREYFAPTEPVENLIQTSEEYELDILSSARPSVPYVLYVLPTFGWEQDTGANGTVRSVRKGGGVRVYLDRPWWSSGEGEMLGVVLVDDGVDWDNSYFTCWGQDPIWKSPMLKRPQPADFLNCHQVFENVKLAEPNRPFVKVAGYKVEWDKGRQLWYCDIEMNTANAYYPFIRLALVRIQPNSLVEYYQGNPKPYFDLRLSPVVLADFVQTVPNRSVTVTRSGGSHGVYNVAVSGVTYTEQVRLDRLVRLDGFISSGMSEMTSQVQQRVPEIEDEALGWIDLPIKTILVPGAPDQNGVVIWQGQVNIPAEYQAQQLRLVIQEFEKFPVPGVLRTLPTYQKRLVYVDTIPLN